MPPFVIEPLSNHDRANFSCGVESLDAYFRKQVTQDMRRRVTSCFVAVDDEGKRLAGYYTLSAGGVVLTDLPEAQKKRLPLYPLVPVARLGRLVVDKNYQGQKLGAALLWDAFERASHVELLAFALIVDAKDAKAKAFYERFGFFSFGSTPPQLMLPLKKGQ
ncbi:GNAT family N-acetyltransferase [Candidatus Chlorohelix sp.]|uniref:GNAT family N-acetyltransferase n=1 Tax=Candidatus Chlorohelix sp. TaxID=3139201 RepID=UPI00306FBED8